MLERLSNQELAHEQRCRQTIDLHLSEALRITASLGLRCESIDKLRSDLRSSIAEPAKLRDETAKYLQELRKSIVVGSEAVARC